MVGKLNFNLIKQGYVTFLCVGGKSTSIFTQKQKEKAKLYSETKC